VLSNEFFENRDWPTASVVAIAMLLVLLVLLVPIVLLQRYRAGRLSEAA
jgi:putrescine transport system permease protein